MKALILSAGLGTRLAPLTDEYPKSLTTVNGKPIIFQQLDSLLENGIEDITIISGYKAELLQSSVNAAYPTAKFVESVDYRTTNNMYSAFLGRDIVGGDDFLMMNADVFFDSSVIKSLLEFDAQNAIVVDVGTYIEESMKVVEENGKLVEISKQIPPEKALGSSIDVYKFSKEGGKAFFAKCAEYIEDKKELKKWSEVALNDILPKCDFKACPLKGRWFEIDNLEDLKAAELIF